MKKYRAHIVLFLIVAMACTPPVEQGEKKDTESKQSAQSETAPPQDDGPKKELERLLEDTDAALEETDWQRARQLIKAGLEMAADKPEYALYSARFLLRFGTIERERGSESEARRHYADAMAIFHVHKNDRGRFETFLALGQLETQKGDYVAASRQFGQAEKLIPKLDDRALVGQFKLSLAQLASRQVKPKEAFTAYSEAIQIFEVIKDKKSRANTLLLLAAEEDALGRFAASRRSLERAVRLFEEDENLEGKVRGLHRLAAYAEREKRYQKARKILEQVHELYRKLDQKSAAANVRRHLNALPVPEKDKKK